MSCEHWSEAIVDGVVGELADGEAIAVAQHLADCSACREEEARVRRILTAPFAPESLPENAAVRARLLRELRESRERHSPRTRRLLRDAWRVPVPTYAVLCLIALAALIGFRLGALGSAAARRPAPVTMGTSATGGPGPFVTTPGDALFVGAPAPRGKAPPEKS